MVVRTSAYELGGWGGTQFTHNTLTKPQPLNLYNEVIVLIPPSIDLIGSSPRLHLLHQSTNLYSCPIKCQALC